MPDPISETPDPPIPSDSAGLLAALQQERKLRQAARADLDRVRSEYEASKTAHAAELSEYRDKAGQWDAHTAAVAKARDEANAAKLAALPEQFRATVTELGLQGEALAKLLAGLPATTAAPPADPAAAPGQPAQSPPVVPSGGVVPTGSGSPGLPQDVRDWSERNPIGQKYRGSTDAVIQLAYNTEGPGNKGAK